MKRNETPNADSYLQDHFKGTFDIIPVIEKEKNANAMSMNECSNFLLVKLADSSL